MKKFVFLAGACLFALSCNKETPVSELIAQEEENYENLGKIETIWKEGDEKIETTWEELYGNKPFEEFMDLDERSPKMKRLNIQPLEVYAGVIRLGSSCGNHPQLEVFMDCEDSGSITHVKNWVWNQANEGTNSTSAAWLTQYGISVVSGNLRMFFCLVEGSNFPNFSNPNYIDHPWGLLALEGYITIYNKTIPYKSIRRYLDNENNGNVNNSKLTWTKNGAELTYQIFPKDPKAINYGYDFIDQNTNTYLNFIYRGEKYHNYTQVPHTITSFPDLGIQYAVFSRRPILNDGLVAEVLSDDEDSGNQNKWSIIQDYIDKYPGFEDYGFIKGERNTHFFVTRAK